MGLIERNFGYMSDKPVMILRPAVRDNGNRFVIKLDDLWKYSDTHNHLFEDFIANKVLQICNLFDITVPKSEKLFVQMMSAISTVIMDGIDELVKMPPYREGIDDPYRVLDRQAEKGRPYLQVGTMH